MEIFSVTKAAKIAAMLENSERSVRGVRMGKSGPLKRVELANQIQWFRIPDRWDASEKNKYLYYKEAWSFLVSCLKDVQAKIFDSIDVF